MVAVADVLSFDSLPDGRRKPDNVGLKLGDSAPITRGVLQNARFEGPTAELSCASSHLRLDVLSCLLDLLRHA
jgi:hypothetical protein